MARLKFSDLFIRGQRCGYAKIGKICIDRFYIDLAGNIWVLKQCLKLGPKDQIAVRLM